MKKLLSLILIQGQEGGGPRHQHGSSAGATGPGYEPQLAHLLGPRCRSYSGGCMHITVECVLLSHAKSFKNLGPEFYFFL